MRINHNIVALNTNNALKKNTELTAKSLNKLSSGLRINKAGDDAAGLSISEKMRAQIRGLEKGADNAQDGISLIQTAEGALNETTSILQRMRELAVQASNDTSTSDDRTTIKDEMDQLAKEITRIADTTKFNTKSLMASAANGGSFTGELLIGSDAGQNLTISIGSMDAVTLLVATDASPTPAAVSETAYVGTTTGRVASTALTYSQSTDLDIKVEITAAGGAAAKATANITINGVTQAITADAVGADDAVFTLNSTNFGDSLGAGESIVITGGAGGTAFAANDDINISVTGAQDGIESNEVDTNAHAEAAITAIDSAITNVSAQRAKLGSYQNRLEHTITNLGTSAENLTAAESRIRDVDMAKEMTEFTKNNILTQAAQSMLAQANAQPQGVLSLLQ